MEVLRSNQRKLAMSLSKEGIGKEGRMDTKDVKKGLGIVPFRHSKLTEALMDYFVGDGRTVSGCDLPHHFLLLTHPVGDDSQCQPIRHRI